MKASSVDNQSSCTNNSKNEIFDDDTSSYVSSSDDEAEDDDYSLADSYDEEVANVHEHELELAEAMKKESSP